MTVFVTDALGAGSEVSFTWAVTDPPRPPVITPVGNQTNAAGDSPSVQVSATQPDDDPLSYDATGLPSGLDIDADTGLRKKRGHPRPPFSRPLFTPLRLAPPVGGRYVAAILAATSTEEGGGAL